MYSYRRTFSQLYVIHGEVYALLPAPKLLNKWFNMKYILLVGRGRREATHYYFIRIEISSYLEF